MPFNGPKSSDLHLVELSLVQTDADRGEGGCDSGAGPDVPRLAVGVAGQRDRGRHGGRELAA